ncbi:MAG: hypothetical protein AB8C13_00760 [Phycisphaerales bacterium]
MRRKETHETLPVLHSEHDAHHVLELLSTMSKKGKLAGFVRGDSGGHGAVVDAHGNPFDSDLRIECSKQESGCTVRFTRTMRKRFPIIFALILVFTVWPGLPLTDSFLYSFGWYERLMGTRFDTWMWYLPFTVLPIPFVWRSTMKRSEDSAHGHALETIERIRQFIGS